MVKALPAQQVSVPVSQEVGRVISTVVPSDEDDVARAHQKAHSPSMGLLSVTLGLYLVQGEDRDWVFVPVVVFGTQPTVVITTISLAAYEGNKIESCPDVTEERSPADTRVGAAMITSWN